MSDSELGQEVVQLAEKLGIEIAPFLKQIFESGFKTYDLFRNNALAILNAVSNREPFAKQSLATGDDYLRVFPGGKFLINGNSFHYTGGPYLLSPVHDTYRMFLHDELGNTTHTLSLTGPEKRLVIENNIKHSSGVYDSNSDITHFNVSIGRELSNPQRDASGGGIIYNFQSGKFYVVYLDGLFERRKIELNPDILSKNFPQASNLDYSICVHEPVFDSSYVTFQIDAGTGKPNSYYFTLPRISPIEASLLLNSGEPLTIHDALIFDQVGDVLMN